MARIISFEEMVKEAEQAQKERLAKSCSLSPEELESFWKDEEDWTGLQKSLDEERAKRLRCEETLSDEENPGPQTPPSPLDPWDLNNGWPSNDDPWEEEVLPLPCLLRSRQILPNENSFHNYFMTTFGCCGVRIQQVKKGLYYTTYTMVGDCPIHGYEHRHNHWYIVAHCDSGKADYYSCFHGIEKVNRRYLDISVKDIEEFY